jgi:hypothetical protein
MLTSCRHLYPPCLPPTLALLAHRHHLPHHCCSTYASTLPRPSEDAFLSLSLSLLSTASCSLIQLPGFQACLLGSSAISPPPFPFLTRPSTFPVNHQPLPCATFPSSNAPSLPSFHKLSSQPASAGHMALSWHAAAKCLTPVTSNLKSRSKPSRKKPNYTLGLPQARTPPLRMLLLEFLLHVTATTCTHRHV